MTAREKLIRSVYDKLSQNQMEVLLDAFAHELAEKIRNSSELRDLTDDHMSDCYAAADLIDPELEH